MNTTIRNKMNDFKAYHCLGQKKAWLTANEWSVELDMAITPQRLTAMYKAGIVERKKNKEYYGDNKYRYNVI